METQTIADAIESPDVVTPNSKKQFYLVDRLGRQMKVLYVDNDTGNFLCCERIRKTKNMNALEYTRDGKFAGMNRKYDIVSKIKA